MGSRTPRPVEPRWKAPAFTLDKSCDDFHTRPEHIHFQKLALPPPVATSRPGHERHRGHGGDVHEADREGGREGRPGRHQQPCSSDRHAGDENKSARQLFGVRNPPDEGSSVATQRHHSYEAILTASTEAIWRTPSSSSTSATSFKKGWLPGVVHARGWLPYGSSKDSHLNDARHARFRKNSSPSPTPRQRIDFDGSCLFTTSHSISAEVVRADQGQPRLLVAAARRSQKLILGEMVVSQAGLAAS